MLMCLGYVMFEVAPVNMHEVSSSTSADFAAKDVLGTRKPREFVGAGDAERTISGRLFPEKFGGLDGLEALEAMCEAGTEQLLVRGDGNNLGWWHLTKVSAKSTYLGRQGVGKLIEFEVSLTKAAGPPSPMAYLSSLLRLFG